MEYTIAVAGSEDKQRLLEFAERNYPPGSAQRDPNRWDYVYGCGRYRLYYAQDTSGVVLGQIATIGANCCIAGKAIRLEWLCNIMVAPEARGRGIASAIIRAIEAEHPYCAVTGANNASIGLTTSLGWQQQPDLPRYVRIVRPAYYLSRALRRFSPRETARDIAIASRCRRSRPAVQCTLSEGNYDIRRLESFDERVEVLYQRLRPQFSFMGDRTADALNFRFLQHPVIQTCAFQSLRDREALGYIVIAAAHRDGERVGLILDWLFDESRPNEGSQLLSIALQKLKSAGVHRVETWVASAKMHRLLEDAAFRRWPGGIQWATNPKVSALISSSEGSFLLSRADSNLHEEAMLSGFAEASDYHVLEFNE